jgi:signal peptidase I
MWIILSLLLIISFFIVAGILLWVSRMFKIETTYKKSLLIWFIFSVTCFIVNYIFSFINLGALSGLLLLIITILVFHLLLKKYYLNTFKKSLLMYIVFSLISAIVMAFIVLIVRGSVLSPFVNKGDSMSPAYKDGDYLLINKIDKNFVRGDVVVFIHNGSFLIKRIVGLPLEKVEIKNNRLYVNNQILDDTKEIKGTASFDLKTNQYFVLTDNLSSGIDSRNFGPIHKDDIAGKIFLNIFE